MPFLPMTKSEMQALGWKQCDFIVITGDAYVDHPSFGAAIIGRTLLKAGFRVGIIAQPDCKTDADWMALGAPRLGFGITAGNMDSMVNHYTAQKKLRHNDAYTPDGKFGLRPDRATLIYCNKVRQLYKNIPIIIGGIEASMRRIAHYDYWQDKVRNSLLSDAKADILVYGMGEKQITELVQRLDRGADIKTIKDIPGTVVFDKPGFVANDSRNIELPAAETCSDKQTFWQMTNLFHQHYQTHTIWQQTAGRYIRHNPPAEKLTETELDAIYSLPYQRLPHPRYQGKTIPAFVQIKDSITSHRGCMGGCHFCTIGYHQGKAIQSRSESSILQEVQMLSKSNTFHGTVSDIGGPSANMYGMSCRLGYPSTCTRNSCLYPQICPQLDTSHQKVTKLLANALKLKDIKHVFVASGIRFDLANLDKAYINQIAAYHTGGLLKLAPEHTESSSLQAMGKPPVQVYVDFCELFFQAGRKQNKRNSVVPYIIVGHPGTTMQEAISLHDWLKARDIRLEQIQEFTPTPMTLSTCMYYTGLDAETGKPIYVPKGRFVRLQKALAMWYLPENRQLIVEAKRI